MTTVDFEDFKDHYLEDVRKAVSFIGQDPDFFTQIKAEHLIDISRRQLGIAPGLKILDVGCGIGVTDRPLCGDFGEIHGVDIAPGVIEKAKKNNPTVQYQLYDGMRLPFPDGSFDLVFTICVMQCVPSDQWGNFTGEMRRVLKKGGISIVFEHNPYNPLTRDVVARCAMNRGLPIIKKKAIRGLFTDHEMKIIEERYILFFPWKGNLFRSVEKVMRRIPIGAQYYVVGRK